MKIGLLNIDGHNFPNLALMKLSAYHKSMGDDVEWINFFNYYDKTYSSKVFTFTPDNQYFINAAKLERGGTGYGYKTLSEEVEHIYPDYSLYNTDFAYGFLTRGCNRKCNYCIVPQKEGRIKAHSEITEFYSNEKGVILLDNNILQSNHGLSQIEKIIDLNIKADFNQGLDCRIIAKNPDIAKLLSKVKWLNPLRMACDSKSQMEPIRKATELLRKHNTTPKNYFIYMLVKGIKDAHHRAMFLKNLGLDPFAQPFRELENNTEPTNEQNRFSRWVNHKAIFNTVDYKYYKILK